ncbi:MAG: hypothetical protein ABI746_08320 [Dermatophilaceae bacterium]
MVLYARAPGRVAAQVSSDVLTIAWVAMWAALGRWVSGLIDALAEPVTALAGAGTRFEEATRAAAERMGEAPLVGDRLRDAMNRVAESGTNASTAGVDLAGTIHHVGIALGVTVATGPILAWLIPWLGARARFVRQAREVREVAAMDGDGSLLALRALARRPLRELTAIGADPAGSWRRGDAEVVRALADLELAEAGLPPRRISGPGGV